MIGVYNICVCVCMYGICVCDPPPPKKKFEWYFSSQPTFSNTRFSNTRGRLIVELVFQTLVVDLSSNLYRLSLPLHAPEMRVNQEFPHLMCILLYLSKG